VNNVPASLGEIEQDETFQPPQAVTQALDTLATDAGCVWFIDVNGDLHFTPLGSLATCPISITETSKNWRAMTVTATLLGYRNKQYVISNLNATPGQAGAGGPLLTETYTLPQTAAVGLNLPTGSIVLNFPAALIVGVKVNGISQPVYIGSQPFNFQKSWWYFPSPYLYAPNPLNDTSSVFPFPPVTSPYPNPGDVVEVTYIPEAGSQNVSVASGSPLRPAGPGTGTCGSGTYENVAQVKNISAIADLDAIAANLLAAYGTVPTQIQFETDVPGAAVGQALYPNIPRFSLDGTIRFLITNVSGTSQGANLGYGTGFRWVIQATTGADLGNSTKWFERLIARTEYPLPLDQRDWPTFILAPGSGSLSAGTVALNPFIVGRTGSIVEVVAVAGTPPTGQDLLIDIRSANLGGSIFGQGGPIVVPDGNATLQVVLPNATGSGLTNLANDPGPTYLFQNDLLTVVVSYRTTSGVVAAAANVTVQVRLSV
jgi:hypothetical protein